MSQKYPITDHFNGTLFFNPGVNTDKPFFDLLKWGMNRAPNDWPEEVKNIAVPNIIQDKSKLTDSDVHLTFVNHSTFLVQTVNANFLTDPHWGDRTSPVSFAGPKRIRPPGIEFKNLPKIDFVIVSHNHYDHMDLGTLERLFKAHNPLFIVPLGNSHYLESFSKKVKVQELDWWQSFEIMNSKVTLVPVQHWSARGLFDKRQALWGGFVIESKTKKIFFAGDTGYNDSMFKKIFTTFGSMDLSLIPIGAFEPRWFMQASHVNPEEAVQIHLDLKSKNSVAMHFGTFRLTDEAYNQPVDDLEIASKKLSVTNFKRLEVGETRNFQF